MENKNVVSSVGEYVEIIKKLNRIYPQAGLLRNPAIKPFFFRGISQEACPLLPSVFRKHKYKMQGTGYETHTLLG